MKKGQNKMRSEYIDPGNDDQLEYVHGEENVVMNGSR